MPTPPIFLNMSAASSVMNPVRLSIRKPSTTASRAKLTAQPIRLVRCSRWARSSALPSCPRATPGRWAKSPLEMSRDAWSRSATSRQASVKTAGITSTQNRSPAKGRTCWAQPSGESQVRTPRKEPSFRSPIMRTKNARAREPKANAPHVRLLSDNCTAIAVMPVQLSPTAVTASPIAQEPVQDKPPAPDATAVSTPASSEVRRDKVTAAARGARRPYTVAPSNSKRPLSSSARVCRRTIAMARIAMVRKPIIPTLAVPMPPSEVGS